MGRAVRRVSLELACLGRDKSPYRVSDSPSLVNDVARARIRSLMESAALSLAKLYHSTDRPADAHAVLASALKGFSPTPEFPEIAEAQTLLSALA